MRAISIVVLAVSAGALFAGSILASHSQQVAAPAVDCDRPRNADDAAFCRQVLKEAPATNCDTYTASMSDTKGKAAGVPFDNINPALAVPACENAVRQYPTSVRLIFQLGRAYNKKGDYRSALAQYQKAAERGYAPAQHNLGVMHDRAQGVKKDDARAVAWYRKAAEQGFIPSQFNLGIMYRGGRGVPQNYSEALKWLRKAAEQGDSGALGALGTMYAEGQGVPRNYVTAIEWFRKSADKGNAVAQNNLGAMYAKGQGVVQDAAQAVAWYRKAAEQGFAIAQRNLGLLYGDGRGVGLDYAEAVKWFRLAADQNDAEAQRLLGMMYEHGGGVPKNLAEASKWYRMAADQGDAEAKGKLAALSADELAVRAAKIGEQNPIAVEMSVAVTATNPPTITGTTNLPDGAVLIVNLTADRPCAPDCVADAQTVVRSGRFTVSSESIRGKIMQGPYTIELVTPGAPHQPASVQAMIGRSGEYLAGAYVVTLSHRGGYAPRSANPSEFEKAMGYQIRYVQKISATRSGPPPAYWHRVEADNGAVHAIDMNSILQNTNGTAIAVTCIVDNEICPLPNMSRFHFDCRGHYQDLDRRGPVMIAPPRSVVGQMAALACAGAKDTASAPSASLGVTDQRASAATKAFTDCLLSKARDGSFTSLDGGKSAIRLMGAACKAQWDAWHAECVAKGGTDGGPGGCTMQAGVMAQTALKLLGK